MIARQPFRKYITFADYLDTNGIERSMRHTLNLYDVRDWNEHAGTLPGNHRRTDITTHNGQTLTIRESYEKFDKEMTDFLLEVGLLDVRSIVKKKPQGPMKYYFSDNGYYLFTRAFPSSFDPHTAHPGVLENYTCFYNETTMN